MKKTTLLLLLSFLLTLTTQAQWQQLGQDIDGEAALDVSGRSVSLSADGSIVAIGAQGNDGNGNSSGHVRIYQNNSGIWTQIGQDIDGEVADDNSGRSVSLSADGTIVAIGATSNNGVNGSSSGHVRIYQNNGGIWTQIGQDIDGEAAFDQSGVSVSLSADGTTVAIGAEFNAGVNGASSGHVRVYQNLSGTWTQVGQDIDGEVLGDESGGAVSLSVNGNIVAIGALRNDAAGFDTGHVRIYQNTSGTWTQIGQNIDGENASDFLGISVSLSADGTIVAIGSTGYDGVNGTNSGVVRVYQNTAGSWIQIGQDIEGTNGGDFFGASVSISGDGTMLGAGALPINSVTGQVRIFQNINGTWTQIGQNIDGENIGDESGLQVVMSSDGTTVAIGARGNDGNGNNSGHVRVYELAASNIEVNIATGNLEFTDSDDRDDNLTITVNGTNYRITDPTNPLTAGTGATQIDANTVEVPIASVTGTIEIATQGGDDSLTTDFSGGNFTNILNYDGGAQNNTNPGDILSLQGGGTFASVEHAFINENDGGVAVAGNSAINYISLEPVLDNLMVTNRVFTFTGANESIALQNEATAGFNIIDSTQGESVTFTNPTNSLTINTDINGGSGLDNIQIVDLDAAFNADLIVNSGLEMDQVTLSGSIDIGTGSYVINAHQILALGALSTSGAGEINLTALSNITKTSMNNLTSENGDINLSSNASGVSTDTAFNAIVITQGVIQTTGTGNVTITGVEVAGGLDAQNIGVIIASGANIQTTGSSTITINGTGGDGTSLNSGVELQGGAIVQSVDGNININGTSGAGTTNDNHGINIQSGAVVQAIGTGAIALDGTATGGTDNNNGVFIDGAGTSINTTGGNIDITGQGAISGTGLNNRGVVISGGATINNLDTGIINITGTGGAGTFSAKGVEILDVDTAVTVVSGGIGIIGTSGAASEGNNAGISIRTGAQLEATGNNGFISMNGTSTQSTDFGDGINVIGPTTAINANGGGILIIGEAAQVTTGQLNYGVEIANSALIENTGLGAIDIMGTGGDGTNDNNGIQILGSTLRTENSRLFLTGTSGIGTAGFNRGIALISSTMQATGSGFVTLIGTSAGSAFSGDGIYNSGSSISAMNNSITIIGQGADSSAGDNQTGIKMESNASVMNNMGGTITMNGTSGNGSGNNQGINLSSTSINANDGDIIINGTSTSTGIAGIGMLLFNDTSLNTSSGNIQVTGTSNTATNSAVSLLDTARILAGGTTTLTTITGPLNTVDGIPVLPRIEGTIVTLNGNVNPGNSFGTGIAQLPISGNTIFSAGDELTIDINGETTPGTEYDQLAVTGTVDITDATLTLVDNIAVPISSGNQFTIIDNDGADAILGNFNGLAEGAIIPFNGQTLRLSYVGGDGNDVVLEEVVVGTLSIVATTQAAEDATNGVFTVTSSTPFATATNVSFTVGGTATEGTDYNALGSNFVFPANTTSTTITVPVIADNIDEADETVIVTLTGTDNTNVTIGTPDSATVTISDNDETPMITQGQVFTIDENLPNTTAIGNILASDTDPGTTFGNWTIVSGNTSIDGDMDAPFAINSATGLLTVNDSGDLDFESGTTSFTLSITVSDGTNTSVPETVIININDVNECDPLVPVTNPITVGLIGTSYTLTQADRDAITSGSTGTALSFLFSQETFTCADIPSVAITVTFTDDCGTNTNETVTITVEDTTAPTALCQNITVQLDASGEATIVAADVDAGSSDACGNVTLSISQDTFTCADLLGTDTTSSPLLITGVYDGPLSGGTPKGVELKVQQDIADLSLYGLGSANNGGGTDGEEFTFPAVAATAGDYIYIATEAPNFTNFFGFAPDYTDGSMGINGDDAIELFFNGAVVDTFGDINTDGSGQAWDYLDGWAYRMNEQMTNGGTFNPGNWNYSGINIFDGETTNAGSAVPFPIGTYFVTPPPAGPVEVLLTVTDEAGLTATCTALVTVEDNLAPTLTCPPTQLESADANCEFIIPDYVPLATIDDNCGVTTIMQTPAPGAIVGVGTTAIEILVSDGSNSISCSFDIVVGNGITPSITCPTNQTESVAANCEFIIPDYTLQATVNNDCEGTTTVSQLPAAGMAVAPGTTTITLTLIDGANSSDCSFDLTVIDNTAPVAVCQDITVALDINGEAVITATDVDGGSTDNCGNITVSISQDTFTCSDLDDNGSGLAPLVITGVFDGPLPGGSPKGIELKVQQDIADLAVYGIGSANNGGGTDGEEFTFPTAAAMEGDFIYVTTDAADFASFFGFAPTFTSGAVAINGDDAVELFFNGTVIDTFGDINTDGSGEAWDYLDGWAYRMNEQTPNTGVFDANNWNYSGINALDGETSNAAAATPFPLGTFTTTPQAPGTVNVTLTVTDDAGNTDSCIAVVTIQDDLAPMLTCPNDQLGSVDAFCEFVVQDYTGLAMAQDNCATAVNISQDPAPGTIVSQGTTMITIFADDGTNFTSCSFNLDVLDEIPPEITCPADQTENADGNCTFILPDYTSLATATDNCANPVSILQTPPVGTPIGLGSTMVTLTAFDGTNSADCSFNVNVLDATPPVLTCPADQTESANENCEFVIPDYSPLATTSDNCGIASVMQTPAAGTLVGTGDTLIEILVSDGTNTVSCGFTISVIDDTPPILDCPADETVNADSNCEFLLPDYTGLAMATDNCSTMITLTQSPPAGTFITTGINTITITADDGNNSIDCTFDLTVVDAEAPVAVCQNITVMLDVNGMATIVPSDIDGGSNDNCTTITTAIDIDSFDCSNVGDNDVMLTVTDDNGNSDACTAVVTVVDDIAPMAVCQDITVALDINGMASITVADIDGGSTDACGIASTSIDIDTFDCSNVGPNMVTLSVTDVNGNTGTCVAIVTVEDQNAIPPVALCQNITIPLMQDGTVTITPSNIDAGSTGAGCVNGITIDIDTFDCSDIGTPVQVTLTVTNGNGVTDSCIAFVNVIDSLPPEIMCPADQTVTSTGPYTLPDYFATGEAIAIDNCTDPVTVTDQDPNPGTLLPDGTYIITMTAEDDNGFESECEFTLIVNDVLGTEDQILSLATVVLYPNPADQFIMLSNPQNLALNRLSIYDLTGRLVMKQDLKGMGETKTFDVSLLQSAGYMVFIESDFGNITKQFIKE